MRRHAYLILAALLAARPAAGQAPVAAPAQAPPQQPAAAAPAAGTPEHLVSFDPNHVDVVWTNNNWQLHFQGVVLKDFGPNQQQAYEALRLIRGLHLTQHGAVGSPRPIMEYWLSEGQAPQGFGGGLPVIPIDQATLRVEPIQGQWCVRDAGRVFFNFGIQQGDALQALDVLRKYGFTKVGYLGQPRPQMLYFLNDAGVGAGTASPAPTQPVPGTAAATRGTPVGLLQGQLLAAGIHQLAPPRTSTGERVQFDPNRVQVRRDKDNWQLAYGPHVLAEFATQQTAREALSVIQYYGFTEQLRLGSPAPSFSYFLAHGQPPRGLKPGVFTQTFRPEVVNTRPYGQDWMLMEGERPLVSLGPHPDDARELVQVIHRYHFDALGRVGPVGPESMTFLAKSH
jgi:hypothetical protein